MTGSPALHEMLWKQPAEVFKPPAESFNPQTGRIPLSFDFDGTLTSRRGFRWPLDGLDLTPMRQALARGYAVHVLTVNDTRRVAQALAHEGIDAVADDGRNPGMVEWHGGATGAKVLVTNRKLKARMYVDDRAFHWRYGDDPEAIWAELDRRYPPARAPRKRWLRRLAEWFVTDPPTAYYNVPWGG